MYTQNISNSTINNGKIVNNINITADSTFSELHDLLKKLGTMATEQEEMAKEIDEANKREQEALMEAGVEVKSSDNEDDASSELQRGSRPKPTELAKETPIAQTEDGRTRVYSNGYALCTAQSSGRDLVIWVPDCKTVRYGFVELDGEIRKEIPDYNILVFEPDVDKDGKKVKVDVTDRVKDATDLPWYMAIEETADNRDDKNSGNRGYDRKGTKGKGRAIKVREDDGEGHEDTNELYDEDNENYRVHHATFQSGEEYVIHKETMTSKIASARRRLAVLTEKQRQAYVLYHYEELNEEQIGESLGISHQAVSDRINSAQKRLDNYGKKRTRKPKDADSGK